MLVELTEQYIKAFSNKDITQVSSLLSNSFVLEDPLVKRLEGRKNCIEAISNIFDSCENLEFSAKNIYHSGNTTFIEFILKLDEIILEGVDIIEWQNNKMTEMRAYLDIPK